MNYLKQHHGTVVPLITPVNASGELDEAGLDRLVDAQIAGGVEGIFVLGTTGEAVNVPPKFRRRMIERAAQRAGKRCLIYAGLGDLQPKEFGLANDYLNAGADAVVVRPPVAVPVPEPELAGWFQKLLDQMQGPVMLYNIPMITRVSIPLDSLEKLIGHPRLIGFKDSENNPKRIEELLKRFGGKPDFSIFVGVGALMEKGLRLGADGIVPSVSNLIPKVCHNLCSSARKGDWAAASQHFARMNTIAALYQKDRTLAESLTVLKAAAHCLGLCSPNVLPPLLALKDSQITTLRGEMSRLHLLNGKA